MKQKSKRRAVGRVTDAATEYRDRQAELYLHRCAVFATRAFNEGYFARLDFLKELLDRSIEEGYRTFLLGAKDGLELEAALYLLERKKTDPKIRLVVVIPYRNQVINWNAKPKFDAVCDGADLVKVFSEDDPAAATEATRWMLGNCKRVISVTQGPLAGIKRLDGFDLSEKEHIRLWVEWSDEKNAYVRGTPRQPKEKSVVQGSGYPDNLLKEAFGDRYPPERYLENALEIVDAIFSKYGERDREIMTMRYGERMTLQEIGEWFGLSRERIRQIVKKNMRRLHFKSNRLKLFGPDEPNPW